ncbi:PAS domain-containing protein [Sphingomonas cannabina]|uniref:PAS domain-containing protein n=1 Tax=Sphingomonas cannabina TaxID=2899123 RepID=UPI001F3E83EF|nr:PAS domain-containing protein [Sphingomonas cannabina]UIJ45997.1 PAS domain-containing protein [Sphingomonas cannabina]
MPARTFLNHPGEMAARIRDADWSGHPLGRPESWPDALRVAVNICLGSSFPTAIYWGPELHLLYNDAWASILAERHPAVLGRPATEVWPDIWEIVGPQFAAVFRGEACSAYDQMLPIRRGGAVRETFWNYSLSPIRDDGGAIVGVFNQGNETTAYVLAERERRIEIERMRELFQQTPGAVAVLHGPDHVFELGNDAYMELIGHRPILGMTVAEALPEVVEQGFVDLLDSVYATGKAFRASAQPVRLIRTPGAEPEERILDFVYQPIRNRAGEVSDIFVQATDVTDRARAEQAARASEERLELALEASMGIGIWDWDIVNGLARSDTRFARLYGLPAEQAVEGVPLASFFERVHPDDAPRVLAAVEHSIETGAPFNEEYRLLGPDGAIVWIAAQGRAVYDAGGRPVRFPGVSFDVTKRREAEERARAAADDLRIATEAQGFLFRLAERLRRLDSPAAIMRLSATALGRRLVVDRVGFYRALAGEQEIEFLACWTSERLPPLGGRMALADIGSAGLAAYRVGETRVVADFGTDPTTRDAAIGRLMAAAITVPLRRHGQWAGCVFVNQAIPRRWTAEEIALVEAVAEIAWDAADRANAAAALRESEEKFRAIANSIDQMVWSSLADGRHDFYNERWYAFTGALEGSTEGWNDLVHQDERDRARAAWQHSLASGEPYRVEYRLRHRPSGGYRWVLASAQPVRDEQGRITRWFGTCTDIQEIVEAREVLARSRADLEAAIAERSEQLMAAEEQLRQAQKMEAIGQLTGGIAHDFNNMLAVVIGALDMMERRLGQGQRDVGRYVEAARDGASRAAALTQRLLAFSRQSPLAPRVIDINAMIAGMIDMLVRTIGDDIIVETRLAGDLWPATADPSQLENAILNLAVNARDAMPGGGRLTIATANRALDAAAAGVAPGDYVEIAVADTGTGMSDEIAAKAFDPFFTTKSVGKGTGLGLSQVFGFAHQSDGHVALETAPGAGTTVRLLLPRDSGPATSAGPLRRAGAELPRGDEVVLVVEDDERVRAYSVEALSDLGYRVVEAPDGGTALRLIEDGQAADLLFTDVVMPEMTGRELAEAARARLPALRVLYTSGYTRDAVEPIGGTVLRKPFDVTTLALHIREALDA